MVLLYFWNLYSQVSLARLDFVNYRNRPYGLGGSINRKKELIQWELLVQY